MKIGSNQPPSGTVPDSAPSLSMPPDDIQEAIASDIIKVLTPFISLPAQFSSAQTKQLSQPPSSLPANFEDTESGSSSGITGSVSNVGAKTQIQFTC